MLSHSNDGDGSTVLNLEKIAAKKYILPAVRNVTLSNKSIPQVNETYSYMQKVGGYAALNDYGVSLAESTCNATLKGSTDKGAY